MQRRPGGLPSIHPAFWTAVCLLYLASLLWRWLRQGQAPGLASATAVGVLAAVWLYLTLLREVSGRPFPPAGHLHIRFTLLAVLAASTGPGDYLVFRHLAREGSIPVIPAVEAFSPSVVTRHLLLETLALPSASKRSGPRH